MKDRYHDIYLQIGLNILRCRKERGLTQEQAVQLRARFPYPARVTIHEDPNGSTPVEKLIQPSGKSSAEAARASGSSQESGGMTFGGTVGAVIVGVIAAILILSFL